MDVPYQPLDTQPDLGSIQHCQDRWVLIQPELPPVPGRARDLGCHTGWFCRRLLDAGWDVTGVDQSLEWVSKAIIQDPGRARNYVVGNVLTLPLMQSVEVTLCLSVLMYCFADVELGWEFLMKVSRSTHQAYFDFGGMYAGRLPFTEDTFPAELLRRTEFMYVKQLGTSHLGRTLFLAHR